MTGLLSTNLNQSPYFNDYTANSQFYDYLFKPSVSVQARELNATQSMLQNQITTFGQNIFVNGTIVDGCNMTFNSNLNYVKILDTYANGAALSVADLNNLYAVSNSGLKAYIALTLPGFVSQSPNLNTLYVNYLNSATNNTAIKVFQNDEVLNIVTSANVLIGSIQVANAISSGNNSNTTGQGYAMTVDNGVIFQKGIMLQVQKQSIILTPYSPSPNGISVGFNCIESIITSFQDPSLLSNAQGSPNYAGPGADRLKIVPTLTIRNSNSISTNSFFSIVDFVGGSPSIVNQDTEYAALGDKMAQISNETNGNFIINPFNIRTLQNYVANGNIDLYNVKLEIDAGLAYVQGYRVQVLGKLLNIIRKGNDILNAPSQIITTQMGNYLQVDEFSGIWNPTIVQTVSLRSAPAYSISNNMAKGIGSNSIAPPGSAIGTANILAVEYDNGTPGLNTCVYDIYLFNIQMNSGQNFQNVRSLYANSGGNLGFADVVLGVANSVNLIDSSSGTLVYDFNQSAISTLKTSSNTVDAQFQYLQSTNVSFSNTGVVSVTIPTYVGGTNELPYGVGTLTTPQKEAFLITSEGTVTTANIAGSVSSSGNTITGVSTSFSTSLYAGAYIEFANSSLTEIRQIASISNNTSLNTTIAPNNAWSGANLSIAYLTGMEIPTSGSNVAISVGSSNSFTVSLNQNFSTSFNATILYPIQRVVASPAQKKLQTSVFVKINLANAAGGIVGPWSLGVPDVFAIANVWYGSTYANTNPSITNQFHLNTNQTDQYYGLSYLTSNGAALSNTDVLLVQLEAYQESISSGAGFFSVDSYPIDDTGLTANSIFTQDIDVYTSIANSSTINLRNAVDFRFYASNTIPYISNTTLAIANTAIVNPSNTLSFNTSNLFVPVPDAEFESSVQYYVGRYDVVGLDTHGNVIIVDGIPSENPVPPPDISTGITLATINVTPYPSLTTDIYDPHESTGNLPISLIYRSNRRYTMADVGVLASQISQLQYYTALSVLEQSAQNLLLTNSSGANRFQNGILADPFNDFSISNTLDPAFNIAIDTSMSELRPVFTQQLIQLNYANSTSTNIEQSNDALLLTLDYVQNNTPFIAQQFASQVRNCSQDTLYNWVGDIYLTPTGNYMPDVTVNPTVVANLNSLSNWINLVDAWGTAWGTWNETSNTATVSNSSSSTSITVTPTDNNYNFGDVVTSISIQPFVPASLIEFYAVGLKPNTQVWAFLDDASISNNCIQTNSAYVIPTNGVPGTLITDSLGQVYGLFYLPADTFQTGSLNFQLMDISNLVTESNIITTVASATYYGTNLAYTVNDIQLNIITGQVSTTTVAQAMSVTANVATTTPATVTASTPTAKVVWINAGNSDGSVNSGDDTFGSHYTVVDPIAQSFPILPTSIPANIQAVYLTSIDLFFQSVDPSFGITFQIRTMTNGQPDTTIINGSSIHLTPNQINTSQNASAPTNIIFPEPVLLSSGQSYCFVLMPDGVNPNYNIWTGVIGGTDVLTNVPIFALSSGGVMFLSSQNETWTAYQSEQIKFNLYIANFTSSSGTAIFTNDDSEYLTIANTSRVFSLGEQVYYSNVVFASSNVSVSNTSNSASVTSTTGLLAGTKIYIQSNTNNSTMVANVVSISSGTSLILNTIPVFTDANASLGILTSNGGLTGYISSVNTSHITVGNSTANSSVYLATNNNGLIIGSYSLASATISKLRDVPYDTLMPKFSTTVPSVCSVTLSMKGTSNVAAGYVSDGSSTALTYGQSTDFLDESRVVMSKSNEWQYKSGAKSLTISSICDTTSMYASPSFYLGKSGALLVHNMINSEDANNDIQTSEITNSGNAINRYISDTVTLASGLDAEDFVVYIGAYYPPNTNIEVFCKLENQYDADPFSVKAWTPMITTNVTRSSKVNNQDFNEYIYNLPVGLPSGNAYLNTAYLDGNNNVAYTSNSGAQFSGFNTFAVKIVLLSNTSYCVPLATDMRAIATTSTA